MPLPTRRRCLEIGAAFIEADLHRMRQQAIDIYETASEAPDWDGRSRPLTSSHENDLMTAVEWATAAATLRVLAEELG